MGMTLKAYLPMPSDEYEKRIKVRKERVSPIISGFISYAPTPCPDCGDCAGLVQHGSDDKYTYHCLNSECGLATGAHILPADALSEWESGNGKRKCITVTENNKAEIKRVIEEIKKGGLEMSEIDNWRERLESRFHTDTYKGEETVGIVTLAGETEEDKEKRGGVFIGFSDGSVLIKTAVVPSYDLALRLAAAWNMCAGVTTDELIEIYMRDLCRQSKLVEMIKIVNCPDRYKSDPVYTKGEEEEK